MTSLFSIHLFLLSSDTHTMAIPLYRVKSQQISEIATYKQEIEKLIDAQQQAVKDHDAKLMEIRTAQQAERKRIEHEHDAAKKARREVRCLSTARYQLQYPRNRKT